MFDFTQEDMTKYLDDYILPFAINLAMAIVIYVVGKLVVKILVSGFGKLLEKSKYDDMLINFLKSIFNAVLMLFVIIASLNELGVDTTSLAARFASELRCGCDAFGIPSFQKR